MVFDKKTYHKEYYHKNKERILEQTKEYHLKNKDKRNVKQREYNLKNREKISEQKREYDKTPRRIKSRRIRQWKTQGIIFPDYDLLYQHYLLTSHCDECHVLLEGKGDDQKCCDHDHSITDRDNFRNILCCRCNLKRR